MLFYTVQKNDGPTFTVKTVYTTSVINNLYIGVVSIDVSTNGVVALANCTHRSTPLNIYLSIS
jgi:hypothetical protein